MDIVEEIRAVAGRVAASFGLEIFDVQFRREAGGMVLRVQIDRPGPAATAEESVSVEDCANVSRDLSAILDVEDIVPTAYTLEVSSPGLDRPLRSMDDYRRFAGRRAKLVTREPVDGGNEHFPPTTFQMVNVLSDAGAPNVVPGELKCRFNLRYSNVWTHEQLSARIEKLLQSLGIDYEIRWRVAGKPFLTKPGLLTDAVRAAVREATGLDPELSTSGGTSDGRFIAPYGIDVVELGPINATIHKVNELVSIADLERLEHIYFRIAELLLVER